MAPSVSLFLVLTFITISVSTLSSCTTDGDCSLNGVCTGGGICTCIPPWKGDTCGSLDFLPAPSSGGAFYHPPNTSSWCASTLYNESTSTWHAVLSQFVGGCGLNSWVANSELVHATSLTPLGPYEAPSPSAPPIRLPFSHNPKLILAPDGTALVFHIGCGDNNTHRYGPCSGGVTPPPAPPPAMRYSAGGGGGCLAPAGGTFPQWVGGGKPLSPLVLEHDPAVCNTSASGWLPDRANHRLYSAAWPTALVYLDCASCALGSPATLLGPPLGSSVLLPTTTTTAATGIVYNKSSGTLEVVGCPGQCLSNGGSPGAIPPRCGANASQQPWTPTQIHIVPCTSPEAQGWSEGHATEVIEEEEEEEEWEEREGETKPPSKSPTCGGGFTELLSAPSLQGPWSFSTAFGPPSTTPPTFPFSVDNPAPLFFPNGSLLVMFRSYQPYNSTIGIARAPHWKGPWTLPTHPIFPQGTHAEDPTVWYQAGPPASYHALFHGLGACEGAAGCHAFSRDTWEWTLSPVPAYNFTVEFDDGSQVVFARRERPQLILDPKTGAPLALINGVQPPRDLQPGGGQFDMSYTLAVPLRQQ